MLALFSFAIQTETQEVAFGGNISPTQALQILQQIIIAQGIKVAIASAKEAEQKKKEQPVAEPGKE